MVEEGDHLAILLHDVVEELNSWLPRANAVSGRMDSFKDLENVASFDK